MKICYSGILNVQAYTANSCGRRPLVPAKQAEDYARIVGGVESVRGDWAWSVCKFSLFCLSDDK